MGVWDPDVVRHGHGVTDRRPGTESGRWEGAGGSCSTSAPSPWGVAGGMSAGSGRCVVNPGRPDERIIKPLSDGNIVRRGDIVRIETGGGGGHGHPFDREPERVLDDVANGFVSVASAERDYGVVMVPGRLGIDPVATARRRAARPETALFHRHGYHEALD